MILEKIKQHAGKILVLLTGVLVFMIGAVITKQKSLDQESANIAAANEEALKIEAEKKSADQAAAVEYAKTTQDTIANDRQQKMDSIASNPETITQQETVPVTKVVPGAKRTIYVPAGTSSSSTSSKTASASPAKASTPAPAAKTKTS
ncbi:MAG: hypothetical protein PHW24_03420 [Candidatus Moranbacteria bacterium]|nr:hypothetical protein [Candidatus Moranbacteria bacterium]